MDLTSLDLRYCATELQTLIDARVEKVVQSDAEKRDVLMTLYITGREKIQLRFLLPGLLCIHEQKPGHYPQLPPGFAMFLRKYIGGARLRSIEQVGFDRLLRFGFEGKMGTWTLVVEFLQPGNMILLGEDGTIKNLLENQSYRDRHLRGGIAYAAPPPAFDITTASDQELADRIAASDNGAIAAVLATVLGLGGVYAQEACVIAGIEPTAQARTLAPGTYDLLVGAVRALLAMEIAPHHDESRVYPFRLLSKPCSPCTESSFLTALAARTDVIEAKPQQPKEKRASSKLQTMLDAQEKNLRALEETAQAEQRIAQRIYEEYALVKDVIDRAVTARRSKEDVLRALKPHEAVKRYDPATGQVELELEDPQ